ncbi:hypothetical protein [Paenibacillus paeoniae]|nr:hypothetical protein [Paenibacillus paeoniae]
MTSYLKLNIGKPIELDVKTEHWATPVMKSQYYNGMITGYYQRFLQT